MGESLLVKTKDLKHSDSIREILKENHIQYRAQKAELDKEDGKVIDFQKAVQQIHTTEFYVQQEHLKIARELIMQIPQNESQSLYLKSYSFRSIFFALLWLGGLSSIYALYLGVKGWRSERKWVAFLGVLLSIIGLFIALYYFIIPLLADGKIGSLF